MIVLKKGWNKFYFYVKNSDNVNYIVLDESYKTREGRKERKLSIYYVNEYAAVGHMVHVTGVRIGISLQTAAEGDISQL